LEEWERLAGLVPGDRAAPTAPKIEVAGPPKAWKTAVRTAAFGWVELLALKRHDRLADRSGWTQQQLYEAMQPYWAEFDSIGTDATARSAAFFSIAEETDRWVITQRLADPLDDGAWRLVIEVPLAESIDTGQPILRLVTLGQI
jgi:Domain of unknown function (DUF3516)